MRSLHKKILEVEAMNFEQLTDLKDDYNLNIPKDLKQTKEHSSKELKILDEELEKIKLQESEKAKNEGLKIIEQAKKEAEKIIRQGSIEAEEIKKQTEEKWSKLGYEQGFEKGSEEGQAKAYKEGNEELDKVKQRYVSDFYEALQEVEIKKAEVLKKYLDDLAMLSVTIAEKVIYVSLKSSSEVIKKMILNASDNLNGKAWVKIYISKCDAELMSEWDTDLLDNLKHISEHIKIIPMEDKSAGTCIIELPDEVIDASVETQVENIKEILGNARL